MRLGQILQKWRLMSELTLRDTAKMTGIPLPSLQRIENGKPLSGDNLAKILKFMLSKETRNGS